MSWFDTGFSSAQEQVKKSNTRRDNDYTDPNIIQRFWCRKDATSTIVFLDDFSWRTSVEGVEMPVVPLVIYEHALQPDGDFKNTIHLTCQGRGCPICAKGFQKKQVSIVSILELWTPKDKPKETRATKKFLVMPPTTAVLIDGKCHKKGNLQGLQYQVSRTDPKSPRVGNDFEYEENIKNDIEARFSNINLDPFGLTGEEAMAYYKNIFAPKTTAELETILNSGSFEDGNVYRGGSVSVPDRKPNTSLESQEPIPY